MRRFLLFAFLGLACPACGPEDDFEPAEPGLESVYVLDFPEIYVGMEVAAEAVVQAGAKAIYLSPAVLDPPFRSDLNAVEKLDAGQQRRVRITFAPTEVGSFVQDFVLRSDAGIGHYRLEGVAHPRPDPA